MRRALQILCVSVAVTVLPVLASCGFAPLYAQQGLTASMAQIDIAVPKTRTGYFLEQDLRNGFGSDLTSPKAYLLAINLNERHFAVGYKVDETSTRSEITSNVSYKLTNLATGRTMYSGSFTDTVTYDTSKSPFTGIIAQQDAQERIATSISEKIQTEVALYFHGDAAPKGSTPLQDKKASASASSGTASVSAGDDDSSSSAADAPAMKLSKKAEVDAFFKRPPSGCVGALIYGKDRSQVIERATGLARLIVPDITDPFNVSLITDSDIEGDPARLEGELQSLSLMGGKRLIRLKFFSEKASLDKAVAAVMKAHASGDYNPEAFIIIEAGNLGGDSALRRLADADKNLASIACYEDETGDVIRMAREALGQNGVALTSAAMDIFAQRLPKERGIAHQEIERLILFIGPGSHQTLTETDLQDFLGVEPEASLFKAAFDAFGGRMKQAQAGLRRAFAEGESGPDAMRALSQHYNKVKLLKSLLQRGMGTKEAARAAGVFWKDEDDMLRQARSWNYDALDPLASDLIDADKSCKTTGMPDLLIAERLYLAIAGKAARVGL